MVSWAKCRRKLPGYLCAREVTCVASSFPGTQGPVQQGTPSSSPAQVPSIPARVPRPGPRASLPKAARTQSAGVPPRPGSARQDGRREGRRGARRKAAAGTPATAHRARPPPRRAPHLPPPRSRRAHLRRRRRREEDALAAAGVPKPARARGRAGPEGGLCGLRPARLRQQLPPGQAWPGRQFRHGGTVPFRPHLWRRLP
jgi:hypothetical protein